MKKFLTYAVSIAAAVGTGSLSALLTSKNMDIYSSINTPPLSPPSVVFPIVWSILFVLMGIGCARVLIANSYSWNRALSIYTIQLAVNLVWSLIFFNAREFLFAFIWLLLLWALISATIKGFAHYDKTAAYLQIPYLVWVSFAGYLNLGIYLLNK